MPPGPGLILCFLEEKEWSFQSSDTGPYLSPHWRARQDRASPGHSLLTMSSPIAVHLSSL